MSTTIRELDLDSITRGHLVKGLDALMDEFAGVFSEETVERYMAESVGELPAARVKNFVPLFVHRFARKEFPKPMTDEVVRAADAVITMGCGDACPIYPGKRYEDWEVSDPAQLDLVGVREVRDQIQARVEALLAGLIVIPDNG
jgi:hypothetical protein